MTDARRIAAFVDAVNAKYDAGMTRGVPGPRGQRHLRRPAGQRVIALIRRRLHRQPDPLDASPRVSLPTSGMPAPAVRIDPSVQNLWGLTRRRALDFGRVTTAAC